jgi:hypothetical protein
MADTPGERFANAVAQRDVDALAALLAPDVDFRGLTPGRFWEARTPAEAIEVILEHWFEASDRVDALSGIEIGEPIGDVHRVGYRYEITNRDGPQTVEQQAYYRVEDGRLSYLRIVCSGFQPRQG